MPGINTRYVPGNRIDEKSAILVLVEEFFDCISLLKLPLNKVSLIFVEVIKKVLASVEPVTTAILGATKKEQLTENLKALDTLPKLTPDVLKRIDEIMQTKPRQAEW